MNAKLKTILPYFLLVLLSFVWGTSFTMINNGLRIFEPIMVAGLRMIFGTLFFIPFIFYFWKKTPFKKIPIFVFVGLFANALPAFLFALAQTEVSSSVSGIINSTSSLFTYLVGISFFGMLFKIKKILGVFLGMGGVILLIFLRSDGSFEVDFAFGLLIVLATFFYGVGTNLIAKHSKGCLPIVTASWVMAPYGILCAILWIIFGDMSFLQFNSPHFVSSITSLAYLGIVANGTGVLIYFYIIKLKGALFSSTVTYIMPLVAIMWGFLGNEDIHIFSFIGMACILFAVYLINKD